MKNLTGTPARSDDFFDRTTEQRRLWETLDTDNVLMLAPRRVGKTSLLYRLADTAGEHGFRAVYLDVSTVTDEPGLVRALIDAVGRHPDGRKIAERLDKTWSERLARLRRIQLPGAAVELADPAPEDWRRAVEELATALAADQKARWLLMLDEMALFALRLLDLDRDRARDCLHGLRALRMDRRLLDRVRWILCGSIGLDTVTARAHIGDTINDLAQVPLGAFSDRDADTFLDQLGVSYDRPLDPATRAHMRHRVGWAIPFHLQILFAALRHHCEDHHKQPSPATVDAAWEDLLDPSHKNYFDYWIQRLHEELDPIEAGHALRIAGHVAAAPDEGITRDAIEAMLTGVITDAEAIPERARFLLDLLQSDGYLVRDGDRYRFRSNLLRDYWRRRVL